MLSIVHGKQWIHLGLPGPLLRPISKNKKRTTLKAFLIFSRKKAFLIFQEIELF